MAPEFKEGKKHYSGALGWVIIPDEETQRITRELASKFNHKSEYLVSAAHITLYRASLSRVPEGLVTSTIHQLSPIVGSNFTLGEIATYGNRFLFWNLSKPFAEIRKAHNLVLGEYSSYLSKEGTALAQKEELALSGEESENLKDYGHPLVRSLFRPHITLLYNSSGLNLKSYKPWQASIEDIQFVEIGEYGSIKGVLSATNPKN